ncbi:hypothetical protein TMatcc_010421 [Talaromyces marneffei ATCC 18224]|nr:hypothetical protein EYB25_009110 [Talaromyces marneffei]
MLPRNTTNEQPMENINQINRGRRILRSRAPRGVPNYPDVTMGHTTNLSESSVETHVSRLNDGLETDLYPMEFYHPLFHTNIGRNPGGRMTATQDDHLGDNRHEPHMARNAGEVHHGYSNYIRRSGGHSYVEHPFGRIQPLSTEDLFGLPAQDTDDSYHPRGTTTAVSNPYFQDLQPRNNDTPSIAQNMHEETHEETTPDSSTVPEHVITGYSSFPNLPNYNAANSQEAGVVVWSLAGDNAPVGRSHKRRKMTDDELVRNRALKAVGGACDNCRRRKKKCYHKDDQLILSAPDSTPTSAPTSVPAPIQAQTSGPSQLVPVHVNNRIGTRAVHARPRPDDINRRTVAAGLQRQRNQSVASSYGRSVDPSMFSPSEGGGSSNGTVTSNQSAVTTFVVDNPNPDIQQDERFGMDAVGLGQQFNGQLAQPFTPTNIMHADTEIAFLNAWLDSEHPDENDH